jgi:acetyltransferase-like isoleucine patch superfamily enzyme
MKDRITWLLPIKNGMPYLPETLASIETQTYTNWEVIVWDNGSTDGTIEELEKWIPSRLPGRLVTGNPLTLGGSLAQMVEICETELCARIDADDINLPERLEEQVKFLSTHPNIAVLGSWMYFINETGEVREDLYTIPLEHDDIIHEMLTRNAIAHPSVLFRRSAVLAVGNYRHLDNIEDFDLWLRISQHYKLANIDIPLVKYRIHENSTTQLAIKGNRINQAMDDCICENAPLVFGCSESEMRLLRARKHYFAIQPVLKIAKHLQQDQSGKLGDRLSSPSFISHTKNLASSQDVISRLFLSACHPDRTFLYREMKGIVKASAKRIYGVKYLSTQFNQYNHKKKRDKQLHQWLKNIKLKGGSIHSSIEFTGVELPLNYIDIAEKCAIERDFLLWLSPDPGADLKFVMKNGAYIGRNTYIGVFKPISIGENTLIGANCYIISANHNYEQRDIPIKAQGFTGAPIEIEDDVWIGTHVVILPGVKIGKGAIIAAHSLVNQDVPTYEVWGGIPAKFLKHRP